MASEKEPSIIQWRRAYDEMDAESLFCDHCLKQQLIFVKKCGIFDPITVPIPTENKSLTGYVRAMAGVKELNIDEIMAGCEEEIMSNGIYIPQSYILKAYMNSVVIRSPSTLKEWPQDMKHMDAIVSSSTNENLKHQAKLCRANLYNSRGQYRDADLDLKSLEKQYGSTGHFHVIKSGAVFQFALNNVNFLEPLVECARLLPGVYELQFQVVYAKSKSMTDPDSSIMFMIYSLEKLIQRFPSELSPRMLLISLYNELDITKATNVLKQVRKDLPNRLNEMISMYGLLKPKHPSCVNYFKQSLRANKDDPNSYTGLINYFVSSTHEYGKAIEVCTKALSNFQQKDDFQEIFERRQHLLKKIIRQNFWDKL